MEQTSNRSRPKRDRDTHWWVIWTIVVPTIVLAGLAVMALVVFVGYLFLHPNLGEPQRPDVAYISKLTSLRFPSSTKLVNSQYDKSLCPGGNLYAVVEIDRADVEPFVESLSLKRPTSRTDRLEIGWGGSRPTWWNPDSAHEFLAADVDEYGVHSTLKLLVGLDDPRRAVIYILFVN